MSHYTPRNYSTTKRMESVGYDPETRYTETMKRDFVPNHESFDPESLPEKRKIFIAILLTLGMT